MTLEPGVMLIILKGIPHWMQLPKNGKLHRHRV